MKLKPTGKCLECGEPLQKDALFHKGCRKEGRRRIQREEKRSMREKIAEKKS